MDVLLSRLSKAVPWEWEIENARGSRTAAPAWRYFEVDAWLKLRLRSVSARLATEVRLRFEPRDVEWLPEVSTLLERSSESTGRVADAGNRVDGCLLAASFLSRRAQDLLELASWNYADATGNVRIALERPPLFVRLEGASKDPFREPRPLRTLKGPAAGRLVRALADFRPPYGVRELAERAGTSAAMASRVLALLEADAIVRREKRGPVTAVDWKALLERWCEEYSFVRSNRIGRYLALRGLKPAIERLRTTSREYAVSATLVAERRRTVAPSVAAYIYTSDVSHLARELELETAARAANVLLVEPFDPVVFERTWVEDGLRYVALSQATADLLTSGDRNPQIAESLMAWMEENESAWRT